MRALVARRAGERAQLQERPAPEPEADDVLIDTTWSSVNYKDALAVAGRPGVLRSLPLIPGIDAAGTTSEGDSVVVTGAGLGERRDGGYAPQVAAPRHSVVPVPAAVDARDAAAIGTAGVTAALAVLALERSGLREGPVLVTGAGGGVGGFAIALLAAIGREVHAATGRPAVAAHLRALGAAEVVDRLAAEPGRPLQTARWAAVVDSLGGGPLANAIAQTVPGGTVAACGLAASADLPGSVLPFILRGVTLTGIFSVDIDPVLRRAAWELLADRLPPGTVDRMVEREIALDQIPEAADDVLAGRVRGRLLVHVDP